jgi:hypothetical protein
VAEFPISYDPDANTIRLDGQGGAHVMLALLLKAKFGEPLDPEVLLHEPVARLMLDLRRKGLAGSATEWRPFAPETLHAFAQAILAESFRSDWWRMSGEERSAYVREVVAAPHPISDDQVEAVLDGVESGLFRLREVVEAASAGSGR